MMMHGIVISVTTDCYLDNHTRLHLRPAAAQGSDYINASYIDVIVVCSSDDPLPHVCISLLGL